jgi:hypothetical protein
MFGVESFYDGACWSDYDPWVHAEMLGAPIVANPTLPGPLVAAYSRRRGAIFVRPNVPYSVERCAIAHELVHWEHEDVGTTNTQEDRANRISTLRLIRPSRLEEAAECTSDIGMMAIELQVTEKVMRLYARMVRNGTLPT